jgi:hypothetical protein
MPVTPLGPVLWALALRGARAELLPEFVGPAADRAKAEVLKLFRAPEARAALARTPEALAPLKGLMKSAGLAA